MNLIVKTHLDNKVALHKRWLQGTLEGQRGGFSHDDLRGADLRKVDLRYATLKDIDFWYADLRGADLRGADLRGANLEKAYLKGAMLGGACLERAILGRANLEGANLEDADLEGAYLEGAKIDYQLQEGLGLQIAEAILDNPALLDMDYWASPCGTRHCLAGWAVELNDKARELKELYGYEMAGLLTLGYEWYNMFFQQTGEVEDFLRNFVEKAYKIS